MMSLLYLVEPRPEPDTVAVLRAALHRAENRKTPGVLLIMRGTDGGEEYFSTGLYEDRPAEAVRAALRASMILTDAEGRQDRH